MRTGFILSPEEWERILAWQAFVERSIGGDHADIELARKIEAYIGQVEPDPEPDPEPNDDMRPWGPRMWG